MSKYNAARSAGYSESTARVHTKELDARVKIADLFERKGLTDNVLIEKHKQLLNSQKVIGYLHQYKKGEKGSIEKISPDEVVSSEFIEVPDSGAQIKALELAYKLKEHLKDKVDNEVIKNIVQIINYNGKEDNSTGGVIQQQNTQVAIRNFGEVRPQES